jgi:hypothetical protein
VLCAASLLRNGLDEQVLEFAKKEIIESYGSDKLVLISRLEACGFLTKFEKNGSKENASVFDKLKKSLGLHHHAMDPQQIAMANEPYNSYVPLSIKLLEMAIKDGWNNQEIFSIPGPMESYGDLSALSRQFGPTGKKKVLYYMVGGLTLGEVAGLRKIAKKVNIDLIIATTDIICSKDFLKTFISST